MTSSQVGLRNAPPDHNAFCEDVPPCFEARGFRFATSDQWGPFAAGLDHTERIARCRCLRAIVHLTCGRRGLALADELKRAESNDQALEYALFALNGLAALDRRRVLASYAALTRPAA